MKDRRMLILVLSLGLSLALLLGWMTQSGGNAAAICQGPHQSAALAPNCPLGTAFIVLLALTLALLISSEWALSASTHGHSPFEGECLLTGWV